MSNACTQILVDVVSLVWEILLLSNWAKFPFRTMDYGYDYCIVFITGRELLAMALPY